MIKQLMNMEIDQVENQYQNDLVGWKKEVNK